MLAPDQSALMQLILLDHDSELKHHPVVAERHTSQVQEIQGDTHRQLQHLQAYRLEMEKQAQRTSNSGPDAVVWLN